MTDSVMSSLTNLGEALKNAGLSEAQICSILNSPDELKRVVSSITRRATALQKQKDELQEEARYKQTIEHAKKGAPPSTEELQEVSSYLARWITYANDGTLLKTALRNQLHTRPEIYADFLSQQLVFFRLHILLKYQSVDDIAQLLDLECDLPPVEGDELLEPWPGRPEWQHVKGREAGKAVWSELVAMREVITEKILHMYHHERDQLLAQQRENAIARGFRTPISEMNTGLPKGILACFEAMDITHLPELEKVSETDIWYESHINGRRVGDGSLAKLSNFMRQHELSLYAPDDQPLL